MSAVRGVTDFVVSGFKSVFNGASESEQVLAQLNAALASTEGAIGITADELQRMGLEMRKTSMLSTEQITEMQVALLTYTDIAKEEFPRALQVAIDQQQRPVLASPSQLSWWVRRCRTHLKRWSR